MTAKISSRDITTKLASQARITKKMAGEFISAIPAVIEEGLEKEGEVRVKGFGTFRLKAVKGKRGRNPRTGEEVEIPPHNKVVFYPEQSFREYINPPQPMLGYRILEKPESADTVVIPEEKSVEVSHEPTFLADTPDKSPLSDTGFTPEIAPSEREFEPLKDGSEPPPRGRRIHWVIPFTLALIILLSLLFYFRNCHHPAGIVGEESGRQTAVGSQQSAVGSRQSAVGSQQSAVGSRQASEVTQDSALSTKDSTPSIRQSVLKVTSGRHLFQLSRDVYEGNPYLWVLIYQANKEAINDPAQVIAGRELIIPALEGSPGNLSRADSAEVSAGYALVYEYYREKDPPQAEAYRKAMERYRPK